MAKRSPSKLSRREREIMDLVYQLREASVAEIVERMSDEPSYDSIRVTLGILCKKGHLKHRSEGRRYIYSPVVAQEKARRSALRNVLSTFFAGSSSQAILAMLDMDSDRLSKSEWNEISAMIEKGKKS